VVRFAAEHSQRPSLTTLARKVRRQPRDLLLRKELVSSVRVNGDRHRALLVESIMMLVQADEREAGFIEPHLFKRWRWRDASRFADALEGDSKRLIEFLVGIADRIDRPKPCLARARVALERIDPAALRREERSTLLGAVLVRQDPAAFAARFRQIFKGISAGPFAGQALCEWLLSGPDPKTEALLRAALATVPLHNRNAQAEVQLAVRDGIIALKRADHRALRRSLRHLRTFTAGAYYPAVPLLSLLKPLIRRRLFLRDCRALLEEATHKRCTDMLQPSLRLVRRLT
jgi:hypothetical protein